MRQGVAGVVVVVVGWACTPAHRAEPAREAPAAVEQRVVERASVEEGHVPPDEVQICREVAELPRRTATGARKVYGNDLLIWSPACDIQLRRLCWDGAVTGTDPARARVRVEIGGTPFSKAACKQEQAYSLGPIKAVALDMGASELEVTIEGVFEDEQTETFPLD